jgi:hypothetical protein
MESTKRNALKHGANAREVMLWSEKYEDYESLRTDLYLEFNPSGSTEEYLVRTLLDLRWRRRRLDCYDRITKQKRLNEIREENQASREIEKIAAVASECEGADSVEKVEAILSELEYGEVIRSHWPLEAGADPVAWYSKIRGDLEQLRPATRHEGAEQFVEIFNLDTFDDDLARIERLDAMIDRTIKRLMQVKTMKQMHDRLQPKLINLSATKNPVVQDGTDNHSAH